MTGEYGHAGARPEQGYPERGTFVPAAAQPESVPADSGFSPASAAPVDDRADPDRANAREEQSAMDNSELVHAVRALERQVAEHHSRAAAREQVIDNLHAEVERRRAGEGNLLLRPVVTDLQHLREELLREAAALPADLTPERAAELLKSFALSAQQALERCGSAPIELAAGDEFSPRAHRAVRRVPAASAAQDATVAAVVADGYQDVETGRVTTPARVHVYRWTAPEPDDQSDGQAAEQENADA